MTEKSADARYRGYYTVCPICLKEIFVNHEGLEIGTAKHTCLSEHHCARYRRNIGGGRYECRVCGSIIQLHAGKQSIRRDRL